LIKKGAFALLSFSALLLLIVSCPAFLLAGWSGIRHVQILMSHAGIVSRSRKKRMEANGFVATAR
jgi:hypothetical protein